MHLEWSYILSFLTLSYLCQFVRSVLVNRTIDDQHGDSETGIQPTFLPAASWATQDCGGCAIQPDRRQAFMNTYTAATYHPELSTVSMTLEFIGVAIYVYFILPNNAGKGVTVNTNVNITLDQRLVGSFAHTADLTTTDILYNQTVFIGTSLQLRRHQLIISTNDFPEDTFMNFDYAVYTADDGLPNLISSTQSSTMSTTSEILSTTSATTDQDSYSQSSHSSSTGVIAGSVIGPIALIVVIILIFLVKRYRKKNSRTPDDIDIPHPISQLDVQPFIHSPSNDGTLLYSPLSGHSQNNRSTDILGTGGHQDFQNAKENNLYGSTTTSDILSPSQEAARRARQTELDHRMLSVRQEMTQLQSNINVSDSSSSSTLQVGLGMESGSSAPRTVAQSNAEISALQEQVRSMQEEIEFLREQQRSEWAQGLSDEPPPGYTPVS